jgi:putative methionine-R-sulfoxide reductase with GAF domain
MRSFYTVAKNNTIDYFIWLDGEHTTEIEMLNNKKSTAKHCLEAKGMIFVENTEKKNAKFIPNTSNISNTKSIICYPVLKGPKIKYIICITSRTKNSFIKENQKKYQYALNQFSKMIILETYLDEIKERSNG